MEFLVAAAAVFFGFAGLMAIRAKPPKGGGSLSGAVQALQESLDPAARERERAALAAKLKRDFGKGSRIGGDAAGDGAREPPAL